MGFIQHDEDRQIRLQEALHFKRGKQLRYLFVHLIPDGAPAGLLWKQSKLTSFNIRGVLCLTLLPLPQRFQN